MQFLIKITKGSTNFAYGIITIIVLLFCMNTVLASEKVDTVYFQSGDRITGEVKSLENGILSLKTSDAFTLSIKWIHVDSIFIKNTIRIILQNGDFRYGRIYPSGKVNECILHENNGRIEPANLWTIVEIIPLEKRIIDRLTGTVSAGLNYTSASEIAQFDFTGNIQYKAEKVVVQANYNMTLTKESDQTTQRQNGGGSFSRILRNKWSLQGRLYAESNSEFKLDLRTTLGTGGNYNFIQNNKHKLGLMGGILINNETSGDLHRNNVEGSLTLDYQLYLLVKPNITISFIGDLIPSFTVSGRLRSEIDSNMKWEIFNDLYLKYTFYNSFDNKPLSGVDVNRVWGTTLGLEYKF